MLFSRSKTPLRDGFRLALAALIFTVTSLTSFVTRAGEPAVTAAISHAEAAVGQGVQYEIEVRGGRSAQVPPQIVVEGLTIQYSGESFKQQWSIGAGGRTASSSLIYIYQVIAQRPGSFEIPAQPVEVDGRKYRTNAVTLTATGSAAAAPAQNGGGDRALCAELVVPKQTAFVGEVIPLELRIYVDARIPFRTEQPPNIGGDGFTLQKLADPTQAQVNRDGRVYNLITFKTAATAAKTGKLNLGPGELQCVAQLPSQRRRRSLFDDFFNEDDLQGLFGLGQAQQVKITAAPVEMEIKPLPPGAPGSFAGAVGQFTLEAAASPEKVKVGEPVTLTMKVTGRGNFDRVNPPRIASNGWRTYPPSGKFTADDDVGISGTKSFEAAVIPEEPTKKLPALEFTYFDPATKKYETLRGGGLHVEVVGTRLAPASPAPQTALAMASPPSDNLGGADILYLRTDSTRWGKTFAPIYEKRGFWLAQIAPGAVLAAFAGIQLARSRRRDTAALQAAEWRRHKADLLRKLTRRGLDDASFHETATELLQTEAAIRTGRLPATIGADDVCAAARLDETQREQVRAIFAADAEARYAGAGSRGATMPVETREEIIRLIQRMGEASPHV